MTNPLSKLWDRIAGPKDWEREVALLHNTVEDDTPAPGTLAGHPLESAQPDLQPLTKDEQRRRYKDWEGEEPGH
jgi:hypothetical protein